MKLLIYKNFGLYSPFPDGIVEHYENWTLQVFLIQISYNSLTRNLFKARDFIVFVDIYFLYQNEYYKYLLEIIECYYLSALNNLKFYKIEFSFQY